MAEDYERGFVREFGNRFARLHYVFILLEASKSLSFMNCVFMEV